MTWFKFLADGATGPFSGFPWPTPSGQHQAGDWVQVHEAELDPCRVGLHLCREQDLPYWMNRELYVAELDGETHELDTVVVARRARLVRRVEGWTTRCARAFSEACAWRVRDWAVTEMRKAGRTGAAEALRAATSLDALAVAAASVAGGRDGGLLVAYAGDAATYARPADESAWASAAATVGFIAATAAAAAAPDDDPVRAQLLERSRQATWLTTALGRP